MLVIKDVEEFFGVSFENGDEVDVFRFDAFVWTDDDLGCSNGWYFCSFFFVCSTMESMVGFFEVLIFTNLQVL